jgi:predicted amidohydrolase YtcJ
MTVTPEAGRAGAAAADLAVIGARIRTLDPARPLATAVAVRDGVIVAVGSDAEVREACDARTEVLDGSGLSVVPGLTDSHLHPLWAADLAVGVDAGGIVDVEELRAVLRRERDRVGPDAVVRAWSVDYALFEGDRMDGRVLEELAGGPALAIMFDLHTYLATHSVLAMTGVTGAEAFGDASEIVVRDGRPTGELREFPAFFRVADALPGVTRAERLDRVAAVFGELNAVGVTAGHAMDGSPESFELLRELEASGRLTVRLVVPLWIKPAHGDDELDAYARLADEHGKLWRGGVAKFFIDGVVETGTAWLEEPDTQGGGTKAFWPEPERYAEEVGRFARAGFACATHAIGDRAVRAALDAYRAAGPAARGVHRIEHLETLPDDLLQRVVEEGVAASMQPLHMQWRAPDGSDPWAQRLGPARTARAFRTQDLHRAGALVALGSDWPVASFDPRLGMAWARLRRAPGAAETAVLEGAQRLDALTALCGYTTAPAAVAGESAVSGRITVGRRADLTALSADPVDTPADELPDVAVALTVVAGRVVHRGPGLRS